MVNLPVIIERAKVKDSPHLTGQPPKLRRWLWISFLKAAIIPLLFVEIGFLIVFLVSNAIVHDVNVSAMKATSEAFLENVSRLEAKQVETTLAAIARNTQLLANHTVEALDTPLKPDAAEMARYGRSKDGALYTRFDNGTTASYYSGVQPVGPEQMDKVWRLSAIDPLMMELNNIDPLVISVYVNTNDSYNRIYPYIDALKQYPPKMDISKFNFYYLADEKHNPKREPVWTEAYVDPAGQGWMISSVAPVWRNGRLEAVVGQDVTLAQLISRMLNLKLPWGSYAMLVDNQGHIIAMPPAAEKALAIQELTDHTYNTAIHDDTTKPGEYNLAAHAQTRKLADALLSQRQGQVIIPLNGGSVASFHEIGGPKWKLVVVAEQGKIFAEANRMQSRLTMIGWIMALVLVLFYLMFFAFLYLRAKAMGDGLARPIDQFARMFGRIGAGDYDQTAPRAQIAELDALGHNIAATGRRVGDAYKQLAAHQRVTEKALDDLRKRSHEELRFVRMISHEVRTPLAVIDSGAQILERKATDVQPSEIVRRMQRFRSGVARIAGLVDKLEQSSDSATLPDDANGHTSAAQLVEELSREMIPSTRLELVEPVAPTAICDAASLQLALRSVLDNAMRYSKADGTIRISVTAQNHCVKVCVKDDGEGLAPGEAAMVGERFFRGSNAADTQGAGLGLYIAGKCLEAVGGSLVFKSEPTGCIVSITLPACRCKPSDISKTVDAALPA
jgi:signal transduction histidine kinase